MPTPDLPVELWLEIFSYLSRATLYKAMGINRMLFELVMDDLYEEVQFISDDKDMLWTFQQIQSPVVARRVRRFTIRPAFLPALEDKVPLNLKIQKKSLSRLRFWKFRRTNAPPAVPIAQAVQQADGAEASRVILCEAKKALSLCSNLQDVAIIVHDLSFTPSFTSFLDSLWEADSVGPNLRSLSVNTTLAKLPQILQPLVKSFNSLAKLEDFSLNISPSRLPLSLVDGNIMIESLQNFFLTFDRNLTGIQITSPLSKEIADMLGSAQSFPKLSRLEVLSMVTLEAGPMESIARCIANHADNLEHLTIKPGHPFVSTPDRAYGDWINSSGQTDSMAFKDVVLPKLRTLELGLRESEDFAVWPSADARTSKLLPDLFTFAPNITTLILTNQPLSLRRITDVVNGLSRDERGSALENLSLTATTLCPWLFDLLASKLPGLKRLTIDFIWLHSSFFQIMQAHRYPLWTLQTLRLTTLDPICGASHPKRLVMNAAAESLPSGVELDCSYACFCPSAFVGPLDTGHLTKLFS